MPSTLHPFGRGMAPAVIAALVAMIIYGANLVITKDAILHGVTPVDLVVLRCVFGGLVCLPLALTVARDRCRAIAPYRAAVLTVLGGSPYILLMLAGLELAPASHAVVLNPATGMIATLAASTMLLRQRTTLGAVGGATLALAGLALFASCQEGWSASAVAGDAIFVASGVCFGAFAVLVRHWRLEPIAVTLVVTLLSSALLPFLLVGQPSVLRHDLETILFQGLYQGVASGCLATALYAFAVRRLGPASASLFPPLIPAVTILLAAAILGERLLTAQWVGVGLLLAGMIVSGPLGAAGLALVAPARCARLRLGLLIPSQAAGPRGS